MMKRRFFCALLTIVSLLALMTVQGYAATGTTTQNTPVEEPDSVTYMDWDAEKGELVEKVLTKGEFRMFTGKTSASDAGWYVVSGKFSIAKWMIHQDINLILCDGASLTVRGGLYAGPMRNSDKISRLTDQPHTVSIYGQKEGTGCLIAEGGTGLNDGITPNQDVPYGIFCLDLNIYGGSVTTKGGSASGSGRGGDAIYSDGRVRVYGGSLTAKGGPQAVGGIFGDLEVYGGKVDVSLPDGPAIYGRAFVYGGKLTAKGTPNAFGNAPSVGDAAVIVADNTSGSGAASWDGTTPLTAYPFVSMDSDAADAAASAISEGSPRIVIVCATLAIGAMFGFWISKKGIAAGKKKN